MYKAIQFSTKHIFVNYGNLYGMDILNNTDITVYKLTPEHLAMVEDSQVSKKVENPEYFSKDVPVENEWMFLMQKGITLLEAKDADRVQIRFQ